MESFVSQIPDPSKVVLYMAGVGGDPMMNPEAVEIFRLCADAGFKSVTIDTNGSLRSKEVWRELGRISHNSGPDEHTKKMQVTVISNWIPRSSPIEKNFLIQANLQFPKIPSELVSVFCLEN